MQLTKILPKSLRTSEPLGWERDSFAALQNHINELFEDLPGSFGQLWPDAQGAAITAPNMRPRIDVIESPEAFLVEAELPGVQKEDIEVSMPNPNTLVLKGEKKSETHDEKSGRLYVERVFGNFYRAMTLGSEVKTDKVKAQFDNGVLRVTCPKAELHKEESRRIPIES